MKASIKLRAINFPIELFPRPGFDGHKNFEDLTQRFAITPGNIFWKIGNKIFFGFPLK